MTLNNRAVVERVMKNLGFVMEADLKRKPTGNGRSQPVGTDPLNVKIKVRKKAVQEKLRKSEPEVQTLRRTESNETIMSFDMIIVASDTEEQKISPKPPRKKSKWKSGLCLGVTDNDEDELPYIPDSSYSENTSNVGNTSKSDDILRSKFPLSKNTNQVFERSFTLREEKTFLGKKCKPGGCLDPPFGEDKYAYKPKKVQDPVVEKLKKSELVEIDENKLRSRREKKKSKDSDTLLRVPTIAPAEDSISTLPLHNPSLHSITVKGPINEEKQNLKMRISSEKITAEINENQKRKRDVESKVPKYRSPSKNTSIISSILNVHKKDSLRNSTLIYCPSDDKEKIARIRMSSEDNRGQESKIPKYRIPSEDIPRKSYDDSITTFFKPPKRTRQISDIHRNLSKDKSHENRPHLVSEINRNFDSLDKHADIENKIILKDIKSPENNKTKPSITAVPIIPIKTSKFNNDETLPQILQTKEPQHISKTANSDDTTTMMKTPSFNDDSKNIPSNQSLQIDNTLLKSAQELKPTKEESKVITNNSKQKFKKNPTNEESRNKEESRGLQDKSSKLKTLEDTSLLPQVLSPNDIVLLSEESDLEGNMNLLTKNGSHEGKMKSSIELVNRGLIQPKDIDRNILNGSNASPKEIPEQLMDTKTNKTVVVTDEANQPSPTVYTIYQPKIDDIEQKSLSDQSIKSVRSISVNDIKNQSNVLRSGNNENEIRDMDSGNQNLKLSTSIDLQTTLPLQKHLEQKLIIAESQTTQQIDIKDTSSEDPIKIMLKDTFLDSEKQDQETENLHYSQNLKEEAAFAKEFIDNVQQNHDSWTHTLEHSDLTSGKKIILDATTDKIIDPIHQIHDSIFVPKESYQVDQPDYKTNAVAKPLYIQVDTSEPVNRISDTSEEGHLSTTSYPMNDPVDEFKDEKLQKQDDWNRILKGGSEIINRDINVSDDENTIVDLTQSHDNNITYTSKEFNQTDQIGVDNNADTATDVNQTDMISSPLDAALNDDKSRTLDNLTNVFVGDYQNNKKDNNINDTHNEKRDSRQESKINRISFTPNHVDEIIKRDFTENISTGEVVDIKHPYQNNEISQILNDDNIMKATNNDDLSTSSNERPNMRNSNVVIEDRHNINILPISEMFKNDSNTVNLHLTFQSYLNNKNERILRTVSADEKFKRFPNDTITNVESKITLLQDDMMKVNELNIPVDPDMDLTIQIKKQNAKTRIKTEVKLISKSVQTRGSELTKTNNMNQKGYKTNVNVEVDSILTDIYDRELVPLQIMIRNLKNEIDNLVTQQMSLKKKTCNPRKAKQPRLLLANKRYCGCSP